jgi:hypothetical protein
MIQDTSILNLKFYILWQKLDVLLQGGDKNGVVLELVSQI